MNRRGFPALSAIRVRSERPLSSCSSCRVWCQVPQFDCNSLFLRPPPNPCEIESSRCSHILWKMAELVIMNLYKQAFSYDIFDEIFILNFLTRSEINRHMIGSRQVQVQRRILYPPELLQGWHFCLGHFMFDVFLQLEYVCIQLRGAVSVRRRMSSQLHQR